MLIQSGNMSQDEFIRRVLERDARNIYRAQELIVSQRIYLAGKDLKATQRKQGIQRRTGRLEDSLSSPDFYLRSEGENFTVAANYPLYIRFLDMKHRGNWRIYNRQVWGILFRNALPDIKRKFGKFISDTVGEALRVAFEKFNLK
ncbi:MAG: hypothetical protein E6767_20305 [Dysgonomonas sp.]|nr:hypothetical protein [Dysgonomonas sp.]